MILLIIRAVMNWADIQCSLFGKMNFIKKAMRKVSENQ